MDYTFPTFLFFKAGVPVPTATGAKIKPVELEELTADLKEYVNFVKANVYNKVTIPEVPVEAPAAPAAEHEPESAAAPSDEAEPSLSKEEQVEEAAKDEEKREL